MATTNQKTVHALRVYVRKDAHDEWKPCGTITPAQRERNEQAQYRLGWKQVRYVEVRG